MTQILKDRIAERRDGGQSPEILKDGIAERRKIPRNPKRRNNGKSPDIPKEGTVNTEIKNLWQARTTPAVPKCVFWSLPLEVAIA